MESRRVLITGGGSGIGLGLVEAMMAAGAHVIICGRDGDRLAAAEQRLPGLRSVEADVSCESGRDRIDDMVGRCFGDLDMLINNAAVQFSIDCSGGDPAFDSRVQQEISTDLIAPILLTNRLLPRLLVGRRPVIINITSALALHPRPSTPVYSAAKAGLRSYTASLRRQLTPMGVRVVEIIPPLVSTAMTAGRGARMLSAAAMASKVLAALDHGGDEVWIGKACLVPLLNRLSPAIVGRILARG